MPQQLRALAFRADVRAVAQGVTVMPQQLRALAFRADVRAVVQGVTVVPGDGIPRAWERRRF